MKPSKSGAYAKEIVLRLVCELRQLGPTNQIATSNSGFRLKPDFDKQNFQSNLIN